MISVVVPAFNEERYVAKCLESLTHQSYRGNYEVIVVASGDDNTTTLSEGFGVRVIRQERRQIGYIRQAGFLAAKGDIIASTDADTLVPPIWLEQIDHLFVQNPAAVAVAGHFLLTDGPPFVRRTVRLSQTLMPYILKYAPWLWYFSGANFAVRADAFAAVGGFDTTVEFGEDINLCRRLRKGGQIVFEPSLTVQTSGRAFQKDKTGLKHLANYLRLVTNGKDHSH